MKTLYISTMIFALISAAAFAQSSSINIPQIPSKASASGQPSDETSLQINDNDRKKDTQADILNNPAISEYGRASALTSSGGNVAPIGEDAASGKNDTAAKAKEVVSSDVLEDKDAEPPKKKEDAGQKKKKKNKTSEEEKYDVPPVAKEVREPDAAPVNP